MDSNFKNLRQIYSKAVIEKDIELFTSIVDENLLIFDMWDRWSQSGVGEWRTMANEWFDSLKNEKVVVEFSDVKEKVSGDLGFITAFVKFQAQTMTGENIRYLENRLTWILEKKNNVWKVVHHHASSPIDGSMKPMLKR